MTTGRTPWRLRNLCQRRASSTEAAALRKISPVFIRDFSLRHELGPARLRSRGGSAGMNYRLLPTSAERLEPIAKMAQGIASATSLQELFRAVFLFAIESTPADSIFVALYDPGSGLRRCVYAACVLLGEDGSRQLEEELDLRRYPEVPLNTGPQSEAIRTGRFVNAPDLDAAMKGIPVVRGGSDVNERPPLSGLSVPLVVDGRVLGACEVQSIRLAAFGDEHIPYLKMAANLGAIAVQNLKVHERERAQQEATLRALGLALEYRDYETKGHTDRVVSNSLKFGQALGLGGEDLHALHWGAYLHDLGKIAIPDRVLLKADSLSKEELGLIRRHTVIGIQMCGNIPFLVAGTRDVVMFHHERWDGRGYPNGLSGSQIPLLARIFSLVDVYDALMSKRPYKEAWTHEATLDEIRNQSGKQFDPELAASFLDAVENFQRP
jgi:GAF domain-containing protein